MDLLLTIPLFSWPLPIVENTAHPALNGLHVFYLPVVDDCHTWAMFVGACTQEKIPHSLSLAHPLTESGQSVLGHRSHRRGRLFNAPSADGHVNQLFLVPSKNLYHR